MTEILGIFMIALFVGFSLTMIIETIKEHRKLEKDHQAVIDRLEELKYMCEDCGQDEDVKALDYAIKNLGG